MAQKETFILDFRADTSNVQSQFNQLKTAMMDLASRRFDNTAKLGTDLRKASEEAMKMGAALKNAVNPSTGKLDLSRLSMQMKNLNISTTSFRKSMMAMGNDGKIAFLQVANAVANAQSSIIKTNAALDKMWATLKNTMRWQMSSIALNTFVSGFQNAFAFAKDLNKNLNDIRIVSGDSAAQMERYAKAANQAAKAIGTTTNEMVEATVIYRQQGDSLATAAKKAEITTKMANVSLGVSAQEMSEYLTGIWNSYQVGSDQLELFADKLARVGAVTASNAGELATAMTKVAATAQTVGVSYDQLLATISTVSSATRQSEESIGTAFKTIYARMGDLKMNGFIDEDGLTTTLGDVSKQLRQAGFNILGGDGLIKDMGSVVEEIGNQWDSLSRNIQTSLAQAIGGKRQYTQVFALFENWDKYKQTLQESVTAQGELNAQQKIYLDSWEAVSQKTKAIKEDITMDLVDADGMIALTNMFNGFLSLIDDTIEGMGGLTGVLSIFMMFMVNKFSKQIGQSFQGLKENAMVFFGQSEKLAQQQTQKWQTEMGAAKSHYAENTSERVQLESIEAKMNAQDLINQKGKHLSDIEKEILNYKFKQLDAMRQQALEEEAQIRRGEERLRQGLQEGTEEYDASLKRENASRQRDKETERRYQKTITETAENAVYGVDNAEKRRNISKQIKEKRARVQELENSNNALRQERGKGKRKRAKTITDNDKEINETKTEIDSLEKSLNSLDGTQTKFAASPLAKGEIFKGATQGLAGFGMMLSSITGMINVFKEGFDASDINDWITVIMSASSVGMGFNMVLQASNTLKLKDSWLTGWQIGKQTIKNNLTKQETGITEMNTVAKIANFAATHPLARLIGGALVAGIIAVTYALTAETRALKKANEEYDKQKEKLDEITQKYVDEKSALEEKKKKLDEISGLNTTEAKQIQRNIALQENYLAVLERQVETQEKATKIQATVAINAFNNSAKGVSNRILSFAGENNNNMAAPTGKQAVSNNLSPSGMSGFMSTDFNVKRESAKTNFDAIEKYLNSDEYKKYVEQVNSLDDDNPLKEKELKNIEALIEEYQKAFEIKKIYADAEDMKKQGSTQAEINNYIEQQIELFQKEFAVEKAFVDQRTKLMMEYGSTVEGVTKNIDDLQSATDTMNKAITEYNKNGSISLDTFQSLLSLKPSYLSALQIENGQMKLNSDQLQSSIELQKENLIMQQLNATVSQVLTMAETDMGSALAYLTGLTNEHTNALEASTQALIDNTIAKLKNDGATEEQIEGFEAGLGRIRDTFMGLKDISLGMESSAEDVREAAKSLKEAEEDLADFYFEKKLEKAKKEISKFTKYVENIDSAMDFANFTDKQSISAMKEKMSAMRAELTATQAEFQNLSSIVPETAGQADELFSNMEEYGESIKTLTLNIKQTEYEIEQLKWSIATDAFNIQLEQVSALTDAMSDLTNSYTETESAALQQNALRRLLYGYDENNDDSIYEKNKDEYEKYLEMTKDIDAKVNKAHEKALELNYKKEEQILKEKVKDAKSAYEEITRIHKAELEKQKAEWEKTRDYYKDNPAVLEQIIKKRYIEENGGDSRTTLDSEGAFRFETNEERDSIASAYEAARPKTDGVTQLSGKDLVSTIEDKVFWLPMDEATLATNDGKKDVFQVRTKPNGTTYIHMGEDYAAKKGTPQYAMEDGLVIMAKKNGSAGNNVVIRGDSGLNYSYMHLDKMNVAVGDRVVPGSTIGLTGATGLDGSSGQVEGNHMHLEIFKVKVPDGTKDKKGFDRIYPTNDEILKKKGWRKYVSTYDFVNLLRNAKKELMPSAYTGARFPSPEEQVSVAEHGPELVVLGNGEGSFIVDKPTVLQNLPAGTVIYPDFDIKNMQESQSGIRNFLGGGSNSEAFSFGYMGDANLDWVGRYVASGHSASVAKGPLDWSTGEMVSQSQEVVVPFEEIPLQVGENIEQVIGQEIVDNVVQPSIADQRAAIEEIIEQPIAVELNEENVAKVVEAAPLAENVAEAVTAEQQKNGDLTAQKTLDLITGSENGLKSIRYLYQDRLRALGKNPSLEQTYGLSVGLNNDLLYETRRWLDEFEKFFDSDDYRRLSLEEQEAFRDTYTALLDQEESLIKSYREAIESYYNARRELADQYFENMDTFMRWDEVDDNKILAEIRLYKDIMEKGLITNLDELERIRKLTVESLQNAVDETFTYLEGYASYLTEELEDANEELEKTVLKYESLYSLTEKHYDIVNKLADAEFEANKNLYEAMNNARWLDKETRELLYNTKDYAAVTSKIVEIRDEEETLFIQYKKDINDLSSEEMWRAEFITAEYEKQVKLKEEELTLLSLELDLQKKRQNLTNTLMERNVRIFTGGRWVYAANQKNVETARQSYLEAQYKYNQQQTKIDQQENLNAINDSKITAQKQIGENNADIDAINKLVKDTKKIWEEHIAKLTYGDLSLEGLGTVVNDIVKSLGTAKETLSTIIDASDTNPEKAQMTKDYINELLTYKREYEIENGLNTKDTERVKEIRSYLKQVDPSLEAELKNMNYAAATEKYWGSNPALDAAKYIFSLKKKWSEKGRLTSREQKEANYYHKVLEEYSPELAQYFGANTSSYESILADVVAHQGDMNWLSGHGLDGVSTSGYLGGIFNGTDMEKFQTNAQNFISLIGGEAFSKFNENAALSGTEIATFATNLVNANESIVAGFTNIIGATNLGGQELKAWTDSSKEELTNLLNDYLAIVQKLINDAKPSDNGGNKIKVTQRHAAGTRSSRAGWSMVNERGIEMYATSNGQFVELSPYEKIFNNEQFEFLYDLSKVGTSNLSSMIKNYSSKDSSINIGSMTLELPNVQDTQSFAEGLKSLNAYIRSTKTINH